MPANLSVMSMKNLCSYGKVLRSLSLDCIQVKNELNSRINLAAKMKAVGYQGYFPPIEYIPRMVFKY